MTRSEEKEQTGDQNCNQLQQPELQHHNVSQNGKIEDINTQLPPVVTSVHQVQQNDCVYIECNPLLEHLSQEHTNFVSVPQHQGLSSMNYNIQHHNQIGGYTLQNVAQVQVYNSAYSMPLQQMSCNQGLPPIQVSLCYFLIH